MKRFIAFATLYLSALIASLYAPDGWGVTVWVCAAMFVTALNMVCAALETVIDVAAHAKGDA